MSRRRSNVRQYSAEDQALTAISKEAESRLAAKRAARAEAREIRMKEIERQQKEVEEKEKLNNDHSDTITRTRQQITTAAPGPRRGSNESSEGVGDGLSSKDRDMRMELRALEDKYKAAMMSSAQLDNEKQSLVYQVELLKDQLEEQAETHTELQREVKDKNRDLELTKRELQAARLELKALREQSDYKDRLIAESGLVIVAAENGELALERSKEAPSANGPIGVGGLLLSSEALDLLNKSGEGSLGTHTLASSPPSASHITHPAPIAGTSLPLPSQPASEEPKSESHIHSMTTESASLSEGLDGSSVDGPVLEDSSCVDGPNVVGASSVVAGGGEGGTGVDAVHALNSAPSGGSVSHSPGEENSQNSPEQVDVNPSVSAEGEDAGSSSQPESDGGKNSGVENAGPSVIGHGVQGNESMEESVLVGMLTSSHDQDSSACKDGGQEGSELAGESELVAEQEPCPGDEKPADSFPTATHSSLPGGGSDLPSVVLTECSHSQRGSCQDSEDDVDEFFDAVSTPLPSPLDTSTEFEVVGKSTGEGTAFGVSDATSLDAAGLNIGDTSFVVAGVTAGEMCDVDSGTGKDVYSGEVDARKEKEEDDEVFDAVVVESKGEEKTEADIGEGKKEGDMGFDAEGVETKDEEKTEKDTGEGKGEGDGAFDDEGPGLKGEEKAEVDVEEGKGEGDRGFDDEGPGLKGGEKAEVDVEEGKGEGDRGFDDEGPGLKGGEKAEVGVEEGKGEGDRGFDDEGPGLKGEEKAEVDVEKGEGDRGFDDEGPGLKGGEKAEVDVEEGKGEGDGGFDDEGPGLKGEEKAEVDVEEGKGEGDGGFDDEGPGLKGEEKAEVDVEEGKGEGDGGFDDEGPGLKGEEKAEVDVEEGKGEGDGGFDDEGPGLKGGEKAEVDVEEGKGEGDGGFDNEGPGLKGGEKAEVDVEKGEGDRGFDDEGPGLKGGEKAEVDVEKGEGDRGFDDEGPGLKGEEKAEVDVEEGKGEGDGGFDDEGPGLKGEEKAEVDVEEGKGEGDGGFDDEGPGLKGGEKAEVDVEEGKGEGDGGFDDEGPGLKGGEKAEVDVEEGKGEGDGGFDDEGVETKGEEKTEGDRRVELEENLTEGSTKGLGSQEKEGDADAESLTEEGTKNQSPSQTADSGEGVDGEDKDENVTKTDVGVTPVVVEGMGAEGLQAQSSQHITDTRLGDGSSVAANRDSVDFPSEIMDEDSAGVSGAQRVGEVAVRVSMSDESNDVVGTDVCEGKESVTVSSESGEHGSEEPVAGVDAEGQLQDVADKKVASQVVNETDGVAAALNEQTGSDDTQNLSAFSAEVDDASPVSAPKIGSDDEQSTSKSAPVTLVSATALDQQQLVMSASEADSEAGHSGDEAMDVFEHDGEARQSASGESCQQAPEEKEAEAEPQEPASEVPSESDSRKCQEESDNSKQTQGAESWECQGKKDAGVSEESEELPNTLPPLLDARKTLNRDLSEGATSEDSEALLDNEEYDFDDIDEVLAVSSPVACKGKGGEQDLDDMSAEAAAEDAVSFGSRDSGLQDSICNRENEASQGDAASFGSRDSGLQESAPSKESEASKEDSASAQSRDSGSVVEDASPFPGKDSTTGAGAGAEGGAEGGTPGVKGSMESLDLEAKLDKMVSGDSGAKKTPAKEKHKQKKSTKFKRFKNIFK